MATVAGSITSVTLVGAGPDKKTFLLNCSFAIYTATDSAVITAVQDTLKTITKNGKTLTLQSVAGGEKPGLGSGATAVYALNPTCGSGTSGTITCTLGTTTADASTPACQGVGIYVTVLES